MPPPIIGPTQYTCWKETSALTFNLTQLFPTWGAGLPDRSLFGAFVWEVLFGILPNG